MTNGEVNRLGIKILENKKNISSEDLILLQNYRTSFSKSIIDTFKSINNLVLKINKTTITAFRLKRISTIINKIERNPKMKFSRMGDIAGIRCIFLNKTEVYEALNQIKKNYEQSGQIKDYYETPKDTGYKGVHIYIKDKFNKRIEIQLRTLKEHNWATLVEITDLLYDTRLKELGRKSNPELADFHSLMSSDKELSTIEANKIYDTINKYDFINNLNQTFLKNNTEVKAKWYGEDKNNTFFLIEASKNKVPDLKSFKTLKSAEKEYFKKYKENPNTQIVLTSIRNPNFKQISIAYANYILSYHNFINDIQIILRKLAKEFLEDKKYRRFKKIFKTYEELHSGLMLGIVIDIADVTATNKLTKLERKRARKGLKNNVKKVVGTHVGFLNNLINYYPKKTIYFKYNVLKFIKKHNQRIDKITNDSFNNLISQIKEEDKNN